MSEFPMCPLQAAVERQEREDRRALWAVRVLDEHAGRSGGRSWCTTYNGQSWACMFPGHVARAGPTPDAARIAAAESLWEGPR